MLPASFGPSLSMSGCKLADGCAWTGLDTSRIAFVKLKLTEKQSKLLDLTAMVLAADFANIWCTALKINNGQMEKIVWYLSTL